MEKVETYVIPMTNNSKKEKDIFRIGKHEFVSSNGNTWEWEITKEARKALLEYHTTKPNV